MNAQTRRCRNWSGSIRRAVLGLAVCGVAFLPGRAWGQQTLYVSSSSGNVVYEITPGGVVSTFATVPFPSGLAVNSTGTVFVATGGNIDEVSPGGNVSFFASIPGGGELAGLAFNSNGTLFVANQGNLDISAVTPGGDVSTYGTNLSGFPNGLAINTNGTVFDAGGGGGINQVPPGGGNASIFVSSSSVGFATGLAINSTGTLFSTSDAIIYEVSPTGNVSTFATDLISMGGLAVNSTGTVFVTETINDLIDEVTPAGVVSTFATGVSSPSYLAFGPAVVVAPSFALNPAPQTVTAGQDAGFSANTTGTPTPSLQWQLSTDSGDTWGNLTDSVIFAGVTTPDLVIMDANLTLNGDQFRAFAFNAAGNATSGPATLTVNSSGGNTTPGFALNPAPQIVTAGQDAGFSANATGTPTPALQWQLSTDSGDTWDNLSNNVTFSGVTTPDLVILDATTAMNGDQFRAFAFNAAGNATSGPATLTVNSANSAPSINTQPANVAVLAGGKASFTVAATGTGTLTYQWYFNSKKISGATSATYSIPKVASANFGNYTVVISSGVGSPVTSDPAILALALVPKATAPKALTLAYGTSGSFTPTKVIGTPPLNYLWHFNSKPISGGNITGMNSPTLTFHFATPANAGSYSVTISNNVGSTLIFAQLKVIVNPPKITKPPVGVNAAPGSTVTFSVTATTSNTPLTYQWINNSSDKSVTAANASGAKTDQLTFTGVTTANAGDYRVIVTNAGGSVQSSAVKLTVK